MLTQWCLPPPLTSMVKTSLFTRAHSSPLSLAQLPGYVDVAQTILIFLTITGLFLDRRHTLQCVFTKKKDIFFHNHNTIFKIRKLILIQHYNLLYNPYSSFTNCPDNINDNKRNLGSSTAFSCCISLLSFNMEILTLSLQFMRLTLLKSTGQLLCIVSFKLGFV